MDRRERILTGIDVQHSRGLEIGPLATPIVRKCDGDISYLDHLPTQELKLKYTGHGFNVDNIVNVDYVLQSGLSLSEILGKENHFDYVIASHVFEHIPNPIGWMEEIWEILLPSGKLSLVIPDKRFCFDYFRSLTNTGGVLESYFQNVQKPSIKAVFDAVSNAVAFEGNIAWNHHVNEARLQRISTLQQALEMAESVHQGEYHDVHSWCFTPSSFLRIISDLIKLRFLNFSVSNFHNTVGHEFYIILKKESKDADISPLLETIPCLGDEEISIPKDFNGQLYLNFNPDVKKAGIDPVQHFIRYGKAENRRYK